MPEPLPLMTRAPRDDNFLYGYLYRTLRRHCRPGQRVLDVGCGMGALSIYLAARGCRVHGVDVRADAVASCRRSAAALGLDDRATFRVMDLNREWPPGRFDVVVCFEVLEHLEEDAAILARIRGSLEAGGLLLLSTPSSRAPLHRLRRRFLGRDPFDERCGHLRRYTVRQLSELLGRAGFRVEGVQRTEGLFRSLLPLTAAGRFFLRCPRFWLTPLLLAVDQATTLFGEAQIVVVARAGVPAEERTPAAEGRGVRALPSAAHPAGCSANRLRRSPRS